MPERASDPITIPDALWQLPQMIEALKSRDIGTVFRLVRQYGGASQARIAAAVGMTQGKVSETMKPGGRQILALEVFERIADGLQMPDSARMALGLAPRNSNGVVRDREGVGSVCRGRAHPNSGSASSDPPLPEGDASDSMELVSANDISNLVQWVTGGDATDEKIAQLARSAQSFAASHTRVPAKRLLPEILKLHRSTRELLLNGRHRLRHMRELVRIDADLLAHAAVIFGDVNLDHVAEKYASAALILAKEAGVNESYAWYAQAKTARWQNRYMEAADLARQGFEASPPSPMKAQLAWYEANAAALLGDRIRAREALTRAEQSSEAIRGDASDLSVWSFPIERQALFALSVATRTGDPDGALRAAQMADQAWAAGAPVALANWAQIRIGTGLAHLLKGDLDGTAEQLAEIFTLSPGMRLSTVTRYLADLDSRLNRSRFRGSRIAVQLRQQIQEFNAAALADDADTEEP